MKEALYYQKQTDQSVICVLCPHQCHIREGSVGRCRVRKNIEGILYTETYGHVSSMALDPIEKKPLRRFKPNSHILSLGSFGCNFSCRFCQNHPISMAHPETERLDVEELLYISEKQKDSIGIAFTYNEPTIWYEYIRETAKQNEKDTILVTNGFINPEPLKALLPYIDAMNIDLKAINDGFYRRLCGGELAPVLKTIQIAHSATHVELTFLAIPGVNDDDAEIEALSEWVARIDSDIPLHIIPFRPMYKMIDVPMQTLSKIDRLASIANKKLTYVY